MKIEKYFPFAFIYMFVNAVGLPYGLLYTTLLTPLFYFWIVLKGKRWIVLNFLLLFAPFIFIHLINGVDVQVYLRSIILFITVYLFGVTFHTLLTKTNSIENVFDELRKTNFVFALIALVLLVTPWRNLLWDDWVFPASGFVINMPRLRMLTYEPSYYATLLVPVFAFYFTKFFLKQIKSNSLLTFLTVAIPLLMTLSMGVISGLIMAISILILINLKRLFTSKKFFYSVSALVVSSLLILILLLIFYRDNPIFVRMSAFVGGDDQSGRGRTVEAFQLAFEIAKEKSVWWGVGPGQLKIIGDPIIKEFYGYGETFGQVSIPNAFAETITLFGIVGASLRLLIQIYLFFKTNVLKNYFRTLLFFYIFIYQFTGSFTTNIAEYVIWILAFTNVFPQFDRQKLKN